MIRYDAMVNAQALLTATATQGGGKYYGAADATALGDALRNILVEILLKQKSVVNARITLPIMEPIFYERCET